MRTLIALAVLLAPLAAAAQHHGHGHHSAPAGEIKALSPEQRADIEAGRGMGLAIPAERNGYPGPLHVLEHADALALSAQQRAATEALFASMQARAKEAGRAFVAAEAALDRLFAERRADEATLAAAVAEAGARQAELRRIHLATHLEMTRILTDEQIGRYAKLRGYTH